MPLIATVDGREVVSVELSDEGWADLRRRSRAGTLALSFGCGRPGHPRQRAGTRYFAHNPGSGCGEHADESWQHLVVKAAVVRGARSCGWDARPEVRGDGWVADVLATRAGELASSSADGLAFSGRRVAFEVQWSPQTLREYERRQQTYRASGLECFWFARHAGSVPVPRPDLPVFLLSQDAAAVRIGRTDLSVSDAAVTLLTGAVVFRGAVHGVASFGVQAAVVSCWSCQRSCRVWEVLETVTTGACGTTVRVGHAGQLWAAERLEAAPAVCAAVGALTGGDGIPAARLEPRSTRTSGQTYLAFTCPACTSVFGDFYLPREFAEANYANATQDLTVPIGQCPVFAPTPHWCHDSGDGHCPDSPDSPAPPSPPPAETATGPNGDDGDVMPLASTATRPGSAWLAQRCVCGHVRNIHGGRGCYCGCRRMRPTSGAAPHAAPRGAAPLL